MSNREIIWKAAKEDASFLPDWDNKELYENGFITGAIWQSKRMFNKEEVELLIKDAYSMGKSNIKEGVVNRWWNQRKIGKI